MEPIGILLLQKTKIDEDALLLLSNTKWKKNVGIVVSTRRTRGGLATIWSEDKFILNSSFVSQHGSTRNFKLQQVRLQFPSLTCMSL